MCTTICARRVWKIGRILASQHSTAQLAVQLDTHRSAQAACAARLKPLQVAAQHTAMSFPVNVYRNNQLKHNEILLNYSRNIRNPGPDMVRVFIRKEKVRLYISICTEQSSQQHNWRLGCLFSWVHSWRPSYTAASTAVCASGCTTERSRSP